MTILPPTPENIARAGEALRRGELVGMPTETVYGLAANALDPDAVARTFAAKGRPSDNPLIVHLASVEDVLSVAAAFPPAARRLAERFWPGPLTLVLPRRPEIPDIVTAGLDTVAVRVPGHAVARALIAAAGCPVSAPSANLFTRLSPTRAEDIDPALGPYLAMVLDGGPCEVGLESTVLDAQTDVIRLLRPGQLDRAVLEAALGAPILARDETVKRSPGMHPRHYAPRTRVELVDRLSPTDHGITFGPPAHPGQVQLPPEPQAYGAALYATLHQLDRAGRNLLKIERPPQTEVWEAVWDRLRRAVN